MVTKWNGDYEFINFKNSDTSDPHRLLPNLKEKNWK